MPYASKVVSAIRFCVDRNCNRDISLNGKSVRVKSCMCLEKEIQPSDIVFISTVDYSDEIETYLNTISALDNTVCVSLKDMYHKWNDNPGLSEIIAINRRREKIIPKTIHWCWVGGNPLSDKWMRCIESWKKYCPEYTIVKWDENNLDLDICAYVREAYNAKKWAFVSDFVRLWVLYNYGGIYLDADVEVTKNLDPFLCHNAFSGFEDNLRLPTGIMGSEKNSSYMEYLLKYYNNRHFINDGIMDLTTNVITISRMTSEKYQYDCSGYYFEIDGEFAMYPREVFCPLDEASRKMNKTSNTYAVHHFVSSWS